MNVSSTPSGYAAFFAMRDAAAQRMAVSGPAAARRDDRPAAADNISLTKPARPVDPLQAASSRLGPIKGGRIDFIA
jgi:hypothetical protein